MEHYMVDLAPILDVIGADMTVADAVELEPLCVADETFTFTRPSRSTSRSRTPSAGVVASGMVHAVVSTRRARAASRRSRCRSTATSRRSTSAPAHATEMPEEQQVEPIREGRIDLAPRS